MEALYIGGAQTPIATTLRGILHSVEGYHVSAITPHQFFDSEISPPIPPTNLKLDVILAELSRFKMQPVAAVRAPRQRYPETPLLVMHYYDRAPLISPLINAGADHYLRLGSNIAEQKVIETVSALAETD